MKLRGTINVIIIALLIVVLPALSWYYLDAGLDHRRAVTGALNDFGAINHDSLVDNIFVLGMAPSSTDSLVSFQKALCEKFDHRDDVKFVLASDSKLLLKDNKAIAFENFASWQKSSFNNLILELTKTEIDPSRITAIKEGRQVMLIDQNQKLRNLYDIYSAQEISLLLEHIAILLPKEGRKKIQLIRGNE